MIIAVIALGLGPLQGRGETTAAATFLLMPRDELMSLPTSGPAWSNLKAVADEPLGSPDLCDQDSKHGVKTLAVALVAARTGSSTYSTIARSAILDAIGTLSPGCHNAVLSLGRQLGAYVLAADLIDLSGTQDSTFRTFLSRVRTLELGGHSRWSTLKGTHEDSNNNWGAFAGASRIAASMYLGDAADVAAAVRVVRGFLGDRSAYAGFRTSLSPDELAWTCTGDPETYTPINGACTRSGVSLDGAIPGDVHRDGDGLRWPVGEAGIGYTLESLQGLVVQIELLSRNGYRDAWTWSGSAIRRAAGLISRNDAAGGLGWNLSTVSYHVPWILNARYGLGLPTRAARYGRVFGYTDWLYGGGSSIGESPMPEPVTPTEPTGSLPVTSAPKTSLARAASFPEGAIPVRVSWTLASTSNGLSRYDLQVRPSKGTWRTVRLTTQRSTAAVVMLRPSQAYEFRIRAVDRSGRIGAWKAGAAMSATRIQDRNSGIAYSGRWVQGRHAAYVGDTVRATRVRSATASYAFTGRGIAWVGPKGPTRGRAVVFIDDVRVATVDLVAPTFRPRGVVFTRSLAPGEHSITIRASGTAGRPMVALDTLIVLR